MAYRRTTLIDPPIESLLDKVDSKFTLVSLSAKRARQINSYYNQLGEGMGMVVPPQVASVSGKPLTIAFEEIAAAKATYHHPESGAEGEGEDVAAEASSELSSNGVAPASQVDASAAGDGADGATTSVPAGEGDAQEPEATAGD
ncbi:MAG TPA: DNA-directed RNA polymerase subunit omega [Acidimicrobiales bacterium]|nr:DNA-directed RNA polymerase subunit omega [Acidimicrobiales bacterium]